MTEKHGYDRRKRRMGIAGAALMAVVLCSAGLPAHAEEIPVGVPYGTTIGELKADAPAQCFPDDFRIRGAGRGK